MRVEDPGELLARAVQSVSPRQAQDVLLRISVRELAICLEGAPGQCLRLIENLLPKTKRARLKEELRFQRTVQLSREQRLELARKAAAYFTRERPDFTHRSFVRPRRGRG